jgi:hypothetical protein
VRTDDAPLFEVTTPAADAAARRLTTAQKVQDVLFGGTATDTTLINTFIDRVSASAAAYCRLAKDPIGTVPTFGRETCRATWRKLPCGLRGPQLLLPWRVPVSSITSIVEDDETLVVGDDYKLLGAAVLERRSSGFPVRWSSGEIVAVYVAGWVVSTSGAVPDDIEAAVIDQVKLMYQTRKRDLTLRSEQVPDVYSATFSVAGGDSIGASGLMVQVESALGDYKNWFT